MHVDSHCFSFFDEFIIVLEAVLCHSEIEKHEDAMFKSEEEACACLAGLQHQRKHLFGLPRIGNHTLTSLAAEPRTANTLFMCPYASGQCLHRD